RTLEALLDPRLLQGRVDVADLVFHAGEAIDGLHRHGNYGADPLLRLDEIDRDDVDAAVVRGSPTAPAGGIFLRLPLPRILSGLLVDGLEEPVDRAASTLLPLAHRICERRGEGLAGRRTAATQAFKLSIGDR